MKNVYFFVCVINEKSVWFLPSIIFTQSRHIHLAAVMG